jgi:hypothetical protein
LGNPVKRLADVELRQQEGEAPFVRDTDQPLYDERHFRRLLAGNGVLDAGRLPQSPAQP